jgi:hypothetical protein
LRRLERERRCNVEALWLLRRLAPDFKTIADFRRGSGAAIVGDLPRLCVVLPDQELFRAGFLALHGSKLRAAASPRRIMGRQVITE